MSLTQKRGDVDVKVAGAILVALLLSTACAWRLTPVTATCLQQGTCILEANQEQANKTRDRQILEANQDQANQTGSMGPNTTKPAVATTKGRPRPGMLGDDTEKDPVVLPAAFQASLPRTPAGDAMLLGPVELILFDLDGTLTCTPGDQNSLGSHKKADQIAPKLEWLVPALDTLVSKGIKFGIMSKSSKAQDTLNQVETRHGINLGAKFTTNYILQFVASSVMATKGDFIKKSFGADMLGKIMLIDDDWKRESEGCMKKGIKFCPVDSRQGGLTEQMFMRVIEGFGDGSLYAEVQEAINTQREGIRDIMAKHLKGAD